MIGGRPLPLLVVAGLAVAVLVAAVLIAAGQASGSTAERPVVRAARGDARRRRRCSCT